MKRVAYTIEEEILDKFDKTIDKVNRKSDKRIFKTDIIRDAILRFIKKYK